MKDRRILSRLVRFSRLVSIATWQRRRRLRLDELYLHLLTWDGFTVDRHVIQRYHQAFAHPH